MDDMARLSEKVIRLYDLYKFVLIIQHKLDGDELNSQDIAFLESIGEKYPEALKDKIKSFLLESRNETEDKKKLYTTLRNDLIVGIHDIEKQYVALVMGLTELFKAFYSVRKTQHKEEGTFQRAIASMVDVRKEIVMGGVKLLPVSEVLHPGSGAGSGAGSAAAAPAPAKAAAASKRKGKKSSASAAAAAPAAAPAGCAAAGGAGCAGPPPAAALAAAAGAPPPPPPPPPPPASNAPDVEPAPPPPPPPAPSKSNAPDFGGRRRPRRSTRRRTQKKRRGSRKTLRRR